VAGLAKFRTLSIAFRYKSVELFLGRYVICISLYCAFARLLRFFDLRCNCRLSTTACRSFLIQIGYELWLDPGMQDLPAVSELLKPYNARLMRCYPVSTRINHVANDDEACASRVNLAEIQTRLFA